MLAGTEISKASVPNWSKQEKSFKLPYLYGFNAGNIQVAHSAVRLVQSLPFVFLLHEHASSFLKSFGTSLFSWSRLAR
jgi:hypothetical protein